MSARPIATRRRAVAAALVLFALWPLAQHALSRHYLMNPWKLGGFAMYTVPSPPLGVHVVELRGGAVSLVPPEAYSDGEREASIHFQRRRHALGRLVEPDSFGELLRSGRPEPDALMVVVQRFSLDSETALLRVDEDRYVYAELEEAD